MVTFEYSLLIQGQVTYFEDRILPLSNNEVLSFIRDISDRVTSERQFVQAQKLEGVGTLAGGIAHEFNNLLAMIIGSAELLNAHLSDLPKLKKYVDRIIDASERGASISKQLLIFSRPEQMELKPVSLVQTMDDLQKRFKHILPSSITVRVETEPEPGIIRGDVAQIQQAILNLILNASDAMPLSGTLTLRQFMTPPDTIRAKFGMETGRPYATVSVSDTGIGMNDESIKKIFDPFYSTKEIGKGTGLGLAIVHGIVKNHNGFIDVVSSPGTGTSFTLYFPSVPADSRMEQTISDVFPPSPDGNILVVDDEEIIRDSLREYLADMGYIMHTASNGIEALKIYREHQASISLVITDLGMPQMGGEELFRCLYSIDNAVKVIATSGYLDRTTKDRLLALGFKDVITKPFKMNTVETSIRTVCHHAE